jgi:hypothetical protein
MKRFEVHIASHFDPRRVEFLGRVLEAMRGWRECRLKVVVWSNVWSYLETSVWKSAEEAFSGAGAILDLSVATDLDDPFMLTWQHKKALTTWAANASSEDDFFAYIEDDIVIRDENIQYFVEHYRALREHDLIPGFLRFENTDAGTRLVDVMRPEFWERDRSIRIGKIKYHANVNPYWAGYIFDRRLANEHLSSRSFSPGTSIRVRDWEIRERAAMGLAFERPNPRLKSRVVVPLLDGLPDPRCLVWHCANNYSEQGHPSVARLSVSDAYPTESTSEYLVRKARALPRSLRRRAEEFGPKR